MRKYFNILFLFIFLNTAYSQDSSSVKLGLGFNLVDFKDVANTFFSYHYFSPNFSLPIIIKNKLKIEPSVGYYNRNLEYKSMKKENDSFKISDSNTHLGLGLFLLNKYQNFQIYYGSYFTYILTSEEQSYGKEKDTDKGSGFSFGPSFGAEYLFNKHFSVGGEIRVQYLKIVRKKDSTNSSVNLLKITYHSFVTRAIIVLRFYF